LLLCLLTGKLFRIVFIYKNFVKVFVDELSYVTGKFILKKKTEAKRAEKMKEGRNSSNKQVLV